MIRRAYKMKLFPGKEAEYQQRHTDLWPNLKALLKTAGIQNYSIFLDPESHLLFATYEVHESNTAAVDNLALDPIMKEWWAYMKDIMETNPDNSPVSIPLKDMFYLP